MFNYCHHCDNSNLEDNYCIYVKALSESPGFNLVIVYLIYA